MNILLQTVKYFEEEVLPIVPKQIQKQVYFGFRSLTLKPFVSLNGNARTVISNRSTAESKIGRLVKNPKVSKCFSGLVSSLHLVNPQDTINVDFSSFGGFEILTFAKQTHLGRAVPLYFSVLKYPIIDPGSQTIFIMDTIEKFVNLLGFCPHLVFDRGFESPYLMPFLTKKKYLFTVRIKADKHVVVKEFELPVENYPRDGVTPTDVLVKVYGQTLRLIISSKTSEKATDYAEPWYLLTNDFVLDKYKILSGYYFRFEIEETFKDLKYVNRLKRVFPIRKVQTITNLLWFYTLFIWLAFLTTAAKKYLEERIKKRKRERLSLPRYLFEQLQLDRENLLEQALFTSNLGYVAD